MRYLTVLILASLLASPVEARLKRSQSEKVAFKRENHCPANGARQGPCKGYVIDHIKPLACGGADRRENMQWQNVADAKAKDKWERIGCSPTKH
jgi:5-methylcytosine-specific restriction endonuclease McrA